MSYIQSAPATPKTHRFFFINGKKHFGLKTDIETDVNKILEKFFLDRDFVSLKEVFGAEWANLKLIKFDRELNEIHLEAQAGKSLTTAESLQNVPKKKERKPRTVKRQMYKKEEKPKKKKSLV